MGCECPSRLSTHRHATQFLPSTSRDEVDSPAPATPNPTVPEALGGVRGFAPPVLNPPDNSADQDHHLRGPPPASVDFSRLW